MFVSEVLEQLTYGELGDVGVWGRDSGGMQPENYPIIINDINLGLAELYSLFPLKSSSLLINPILNVTKYTLDKKYSISSPQVGFIPFIDDTATSPYNNDLLKIEQVFDELNKEFVLNDSSNTNSLFTPQYNVLEIPIVNMNTVYNVTYRANHIKLDPYLQTPETAEIILPYNFMQALLYYIASRILPTTPSMQGDTGESIKYLNLFKAEIIKLKTINSINNAELQNTNLEIQGWV